MRKTTPRPKFLRSLLPAPIDYLNYEGLIRSVPKAAWASIKCPVHKSGEELNPSLRVSLADGRFRCMACGAKGGDILALHRLRTGGTFLDAARELGALL